MALIDNYLKKKDKISVERPRELLIDRYTIKERAPVVEAKKESISLLDRIKGVGLGAGKFIARAGIEAANLFTSTLDFAADLLSKRIEKQKRRPSIVVGPIVIPIGKETEARKKMADRWKNLYATTGGEITEKMKSFTEDLRKIDFIQPSEEWVNASTKDKFTKKLPETILNIGPGVVSSLGMFAINPAVGIAVSAGSVADELKTVAMENGVSEERAELLGLGTGLLVGWLDRIVPDEIFSPQQKKTFVSGFAKRILKTGLKEAGTEVLQENIQLLAEATVREDITKDEVIVRNLMSGLGGILGGVGAQTTVSFVNGIRSGDIGGLEEDFVKPPVVEEKPKRVEVKPKDYVSAKDYAKAEFDAEPTAQIGEIDAKRITPRDTVDEAGVESYIKRVEAGEKIEPVEIVKKGKELITIEGSHRVIAHQRLNKNVAVVFRGEGKIEGLKTIEDVYKGAEPSLPKKVFVKPKAEKPVNIKHAQNLIQKALAKDIKTKDLKYVQDLFVKLRDEKARALRSGVDTVGTSFMKQGTIINNLEHAINELAKTRQEFIRIAKPKVKAKPPVKKPAKKRIKPTKKVVKVPKRQLPVGEGKEKVSRLQARLKGELDKTSSEDIEELGQTTFRQMNQDAQIAKAMEYAENNEDEAIKVVFGEIDPPKGILQNSVFAALTELARTDTDLATRIATLTSTRFGQEINILKKILADNPVVMMQDIVKTRIEAYEKRTGKRAEARVKKEIAKITKKAQPTTKEQWNSFLLEIAC